MNFVPWFKSLIRFDQWSLISVLRVIIDKIFRNFPSFHASIVRDADEIGGDKASEDVTDTSEEGGDTNETVKKQTLLYINTPSNVTKAS